MTKAESNPRIGFVMGEAGFDVDCVEAQSTPPSGRPWIARLVAAPGMGPGVR